MLDNIVKMCYGFFELSWYYEYCLLERKGLFLLGCVWTVLLTGPMLVNARKVEVAGIWCSKFLMSATALKEKGARSLVLKVGACFFVNYVCLFCIVLSQPCLQVLSGQKGHH